MTAMLSILEKLFGACTPSQREELQRLLDSLSSTEKTQTSAASAISATIPKLKTVSGRLTTAGTHEILAAIGNNKYNIFGYCFTTTATTEVEVKLYSAGANLVEKWRLTLQAPSAVGVGANLAVTPPAFLFDTDYYAALKININQSVTLHYALAYFEGTE